MRISHRLVLLGSCGIAGCAPALAQNAVSAPPAVQQTDNAPSTAAPAGAGIADIVVTAQKRSERLSDVPISITAQTGDQLQKLGITSPGDLMKVVPGFSFSPSAYGTPIYSIRGVGFYDDAIAISPAVSVYTDQIPLAFPRMTEGATLDVERVEVLKGPQGTLFGQNSTGGAINYIAAKPTDEFHWGGDLGYGRFAAAEADGFLSGPITDTLKARVAVRDEQRGDWQISNSRPGDTLGQRDYFTGRLLLDWQPADTLKFELNVNGWRDRSDTQAQQYSHYQPNTPVGGNQASLTDPNFQTELQQTPRSPDNARAADWDPTPEKFVPNFRRNDSFWQTALRGDLAITDAINLVSISAYSALKVDTPSDIDGTPLQNDVATLVGDVKSFSQELRLAGNLDDRRLNWMIGGNYQHDDTRESHIDAINGTNTAIGPLVFDELAFSNNQKIRTISGFASLDFDLTSKLTLQASTRYQHQTRHFEGCLYDPGTDGTLGVAFGSLSNQLSGSDSPFPFGTCVTLDDATNKPTDVFSSRTDNNVSWRGGLSWKPITGTMLYGNVTRGYKAASYGTLPLIRPDQATPVPPEQLTAYEVGFKSDFFRRRLSLSGALFYYDYRNKQLRGYLQTGFPFGALTALVSIPKSRVKGAEIDATVIPVPGLTLNVGATYLGSKVTGGSTLEPTPLGNVIDIRGLAFPNTPKWQILGDAEYDFSVSERHRIFVGANVSYRSTTTAFFQDTNDFTLPKYALLDVRAGIEAKSGQWRLEFWGKNVTNKYYLLHAEKVVDTVTRTAGMPVTYGLRFSVRY